MCWLCQAQASDYQVCASALAKLPAGDSSVGDVHFVAVFDEYSGLASYVADPCELEDEEEDELAIGQVSDEISTPEKQAS